MISEEYVNNITNIRVVYGQSDYTFRICSYLTALSPNTNFRLMSFPLATDRPDGTEFDFSLYDEELKNLPRKTIIYLAFSQKYQLRAQRRLELLGFSRIYPYGSALDNFLKARFWRQYFADRGLPFREIYDWPQEHEDNSATIAVYLAKRLGDHPVVDYPQDLGPYVIPIQVGAALTAERVAEVLDSTGDNISRQNRHYSEMTAFYWMWKNAGADYLGLCHYRRLWVNLETIVEKLRTTNIEAVLPLPTLCEHSVHEDYLLKHISTVWPVMMDVLKKFSPEYYVTAKKIFSEQIFYASNMCILRRNVLDDLCKWMFPIVMETERRVGDLSNPYYNRYAGFCTERLITLYFLYNKRAWRIAHAEKLFIA